MRKAKLLLIISIATIFLVLPSPIFAVEFNLGQRLSPSKAITPIVNLLSKAKSVITTRYDAVIDRLNLIKGRLSQNRRLNTEEINELEKKIDGEIDFLNKKKEEMQQAQNREDVLQIISETKNQQIAARREAKSTAGKIIIDKINPILTKLDDARNRIKDAANNANISAEKKSRINALLADYDKNIVEAKDKIHQAKGKFDTNFFAEGIKLLKDARGDLKAAQANLKQAIVELKKK